MVVVTFRKRGRPECLLVIGAQVEPRVALVNGLPSGHEPGCDAPGVAGAGRGVGIAVVDEAGHHTCRQAQALPGGAS